MADGMVLPWCSSRVWLYSNFTWNHLITSLSHSLIPWQWQKWLERSDCFNPFYLSLLWLSFAACRQTWDHPHPLSFQLLYAVTSYSEDNASQRYEYEIKEGERDREKISLVVKCLLMYNSCWFAQGAEMEWMNARVEEKCIFVRAYERFRRKTKESIVCERKRLVLSMSDGSSSSLSSSSGKCVCVSYSFSTSRSCCTHGSSSVWSACCMYSVKALSFSFLRWKACTLHLPQRVAESPLFLEVRIV